MPSDVWAASLHLQTVKYLNVASLTLLVFDYSLTFEREVRLIWHSTWGTHPLVIATPLLFVLSRYAPFFCAVLVIKLYLGAHMTLADCRTVNSAAAWFTVFSTSWAEGVLVMRTYAIWKCNQIILIVLGILSMIMLVAALTVTGMFLKLIEFVFPPSPSISGCYPIQKGSHVLIAEYMMLIIFETLIMSLTLYQGVKHYRASNSPLVAILYRDGLLYYMYICVISAANIVVLTTLPAEYFDLLLNFQTVMHSILAGRVVLHLRDADMIRDQDTLLYSTPLQFVHDDMLATDTVESF